jgi:hypothetical protein
MMTRDEALHNLGKFMFIVANNEDNYKAIHGRITEVDKSGIWYVDNEDQPHYFKLRNIHSFELMHFNTPETNIP